jgi:hypothetical protein
MLLNNNQTVHLYGIEKNVIDKKVHSYEY